MPELTNPSGKPIYKAFRAANVDEDLAYTATESVQEMAGNIIIAKIEAQNAKMEAQVAELKAEIRNIYRTIGLGIAAGALILALAQIVISRGAG